MKFDFQVNIEKRNPWTGNVFMVDRMTSDYAQAHPFDVDGFIEEVYEKWADCETVGFRETREALRRQWVRTLSVTSPRGDASLYPNKNGEHHPALMEVWHKACDYWRRGFRMGDVLPEIVPSHTITRLDGGWIALFPKDMGLLTMAEPEPVIPSAVEESPAVEDVAVAEPVEVEPTPEPVAVEEPTPVVIPSAVEESPTPVIRHRRNRRSPAPSPQPDLFAQEEEISCVPLVASDQRSSAPQGRNDNFMSDDTKKKLLCGVATAVVFLVLINTIGLFGIAALGLIAGGLVK